MDRRERIGCSAQSVLRQINWCAALFARAGSAPYSAGFTRL